MRILSPEWLALLPILAGMGWTWRRLRLATPLRALILAGLVVVLAHPEIRRGGSGLDLWVLVDRSASADALIAGHAAEWEAVLSRSKAPGDRLLLVDFADTAMLREAGGREGFAGDPGHTRIPLALRYVLTEIDPARNNRFLILTDGFSTEPLDAVADRLLAAGVALDYRLVAADDAEDVALVGLRLPTQTLVGEPFLVEASIAGAADQPVDVQVFRDGTPIGSTQLTVADGRATLRFMERLSAPGAARYRVAVSAARDRYPGNNWAEHWVEAAGGSRILLVTGYADDPLADVLRIHGLDVDVVAGAGALHAGRLSGARAVVLNNVPAYRLPADVLKALPFFVREQGGGLWMIGGEFSFGAGGYFESPIDPLLPVSMELKEEHRKLAIALAIVLDRSGSMAAAAPGAPGVTKMDLANQGAARSIDLLGARDRVAVFAVDSQAHEVVPLAPLGDHRQRLLDVVRRIRSGGGGIYVYTGLRAAWDALEDAPVEQRHVILFSDAADAEEPGDYAVLIEEMAAAGATVSVIGLGTEQDPDAELLRDIARRGGGRVFFNEDPKDLPALFAQEVVAVARSAFVEEAVGVVDAGGWPEMTARPVAWPSRVDAYNLSYLRPAATAGAVSADDERAPLTAWWRRGLGRVMAVSFPMAGPYSESVRTWAGYGDFAQTAARWILADEAPPGIAVRTSLDGTVLGIDLLYDERWEDRIARRPPDLLLERLGGESIRRVVWDRLAPGHYRAAVSLEPREAVRGVIQVDRTALPFGPITAGSDAEWSFSRERRTAVRELARRSGGVERVNLASIWDAPRAPAYQDARPWLLAGLLVLVVCEALVSRVGWSLPALPGRRAAPPGPARRSRSEPSRPSEPPPIHPPAPPPAFEEDAEAAAARRRSRFARAKRRGP